MWGGNAVAGKMASGHVSPFLLTSSRWALAILILVPISWKYIKKDWPLIRKNLMFLACCGAIGFTLFNNLLYMALTYTSAINVAIEQASMPLVVFLLNYLLFKTRVTFYQTIGFSITLIGVIITATRGSLSVVTDGGFNIGDGLMLLAITCYGIYSVIIRSKPNIHYLSFLTILSISALITSIPFTFYEMGTPKFIFPDTIGWGVIIYAGFLPSVAAQLFWVMGLDQIGSNRGGIFINLVPVFGTALAILILGEKFEVYHAAGFVLVLGGVMLAQKISSPKTT